MVCGLLAAGFTTIRDPGDFDLDRAHLDVHDATEAGVFIGPRVVGADRFVTRTGGRRLPRDARAAGSDGARAHLLGPHLLPEPISAEPDAWWTQWKADPDAARKQVQAALAAGAPIAFGTDSGLHHHGEGIRQLAMFADAGMTPVETLRTITVNGAQLLGFDKAGQIAAGYDADLIAVKRDPTKNVRVLEAVAFVMRGGIVVSADGSRAAP